MAALLALGAGAQQIRSNYRTQSGLTHISTDYELITIGNIPTWTRVEFVGMQDGSGLYLLYMNMEQKEAVSAPKGVKMAVTLKGGKIIRLDQIGQNSATPRRLDNGMFRNTLKYAAETDDMVKMTRGVSSLDIVTGWEPEDYIQASFPDNAFGDLLKRHCAAILDASKGTVDLKANLAAYTENTGSIMASPGPIVARGDNFVYNVILSSIYYKNTAGEDYDLAFVIGTDAKMEIPYDATVRFNFRDGSAIELLNAREDVNFVYVYPSTEDIYNLASKGIASIVISGESGPILADTFPEGPDDFSSVLNQQLQLLVSVSPR